MKKLLLSVAATLATTLVPLPTFAVGSALGTSTKAVSGLASDGTTSTVTITAPTNGTLVVKDASGSEITSGAEVETGSTITIVANPKSLAYKVTALTVNGTAINANDDGTYSCTVSAATTIAATFDLKYGSIVTSGATTITRSDKRNVYAVILRAKDDDGNEGAIERGQITIDEGKTTTARDIWQDKTDQTINVFAGDVITIKVKGEGKGVGEYMYVDWNNDEEFNVVAEKGVDKRDTTGENEFVSYNMCRLGGSGSTYYNSAGESFSRDSNKDYIGGATTDEEGPYYPLPTFTVPSVAPGKYYARFKTTWNNNAANWAKEGDGSEVIDFIIQVLAVSTEPSTVTISESENGSLKVYNGDTEVQSGEKVEVNTVLTIKATPNDGYLLQSVTANDEDLDANSDGAYQYTIIGKDVTFAASFVAKADFKSAVTFTQPSEGGSIAVKVDGAEIASGAKFGYETPVTIVATPGSYAYKVNTITVNNKALEAGEDGTYSFILTEDSEIAATFATKYGKGDGTTNMKNNANVAVYSVILRSGDETRGTITLDEVGDSDDRLIWQDKTDQDPIKVYPGEELTIKITGKGSGKCEYMYVDWNDNGTFDLNTGSAGTNVRNNADNELVSFNMDRYDINGSGSFYNSEGQTVTVPSTYYVGGATTTEEGPTVELPKFTASEKVGLYYARFKVDWNNQDPVNQGKWALQGVGAEQIDFLIEVVNHEKREVSVSVPETNSKYGSVKIKGSDDACVETADNVVVIAEPSESLADVQFMGWTLGSDKTNTIISKDSEFEYSAAEAASLVAHFGYTISGASNGLGSITLSTTSANYKDVTAANAAPARREAQTDSEDAAESTSDRSVTIKQNDKGSEVFEAGTTIYLNAIVNESSGYHISTITITDKYTNQETKYDLSQDEDNLSATVPLKVESPIEVSVAYNSASDGVEDIAVDAAGEAVYYNLNGVRVDGQLAPGLYIRRTANTAQKVVIK